MSSRALSLATVFLLIGFGVTDTVLAQATNLEAGKAPSQLFAQTCSACHKSPRGLLKTVAPGSLPGFLRQHYTTSSDMAGVLASYLVSNGATDTRYQAKDGKDKKDGAKEKEANTAPGQAPDHQGRRQRSQDAAKPDGEAAAPEGARQKRAARPPEEGSKEGAKPEGQAAPEGRKAKRRAKPGTEEAPKVDAAAPAIEDKKSEPKAETKPDTTRPDSAKVEPGRDEAKPENKPAEKPAEARPDSAKVEPRGSDTPALRPDPVPQVTPAAPSAAAKPAEAKPAEEAAKPAAPAVSSEPAAKPQEPAPPATAAAPPAAPADSSGPPTPPISR
ncbi:hypothetical protein ABIB94_002380 [Bradyrhizobium sp. JR7.2]|uniref:Cytochrome c domain-containing protein n=1 Tax=Bradyrhizobium barranii TaxID=2992140 RepID=A0ABY3QXV5_9BRAD|nr:MULTISPECIES: hypothetical protein [Bradyrhizobium]UFW90697.1 hypothetical protein BjapCC829_20030 [Bradyrhizobium japonicum]WFT99256.1 hypothetical protein QA633_20485 [Bradyrhizobium barranii]